MLSATKDLGRANEILRFAQDDMGEFRMISGGGSQDDKRDHSRFASARQSGGALSC